MLLKTILAFTTFTKLLLLLDTIINQKKLNYDLIIKIMIHLSISRSENVFPKCCSVGQVTRRIIVSYNYSLAILPGDSKP